MRRLLIGLSAALMASASVPAFANTLTTNYSLNKPTVGADSNNWGNLSNSNWDSLDSIVFGIQGTANGACPKAGCTFTGGITGTTASFSGASSFGSTAIVTGLLSANGGESITGNLVASGTGTFNGGTVAISGAAASVRGVNVQTAGVARWQFGADQTAESGSNAGSNFFINALSDAGAFIAQPISISRATGVVTLNQGLAVGAVGINDAGGLTVANGFVVSGGGVSVPAGSLVNADLDTVNGSGGSCGSTTSTCVITANAQGRITGASAAPTHDTMSVSTSGALETNDGTNVHWSTRVSAYFSGCSSSGCTMAAGNGISGATRNALGNYTINFTRNFPNTNYTVLCTAGAANASLWNTVCTDNTLNTSRSVNGVTVELDSAGSNTPTDNPGGFNILVIQN